jgi:peptidylprolyl isomerase
VIKGIREGAAGKPSPMSDEDYQKLLNKYLTKAYTDLAEKNLNEANEFLATNKGKSGVKEIEEGKLQYEVLQEGNGKEVTSDSTPEIEYTGKFIDGKVFDESAKRGGPVSIPLKNTIQGFSKGIAGMKEGEKRRLYIHPDLGYGTAGQLPPNSLLIFDVEVVKADTGKETKEDTHTGNGKKPSNETSELDDDEDGLDDDDEDFQLPPW